MRVSQLRFHPSHSSNWNNVLANVPSKQLTHPNYRPDIDGLRAVAVLCVVGFHAFPGSVRGGFVGVDIFFVISGFLISTIIIDSIERGAFSFVQFYSRRIRRIFPALAIVLIACYGLGWVSLLRDEFRQLGMHIFGGAAFLSNFVLWSGSGYFDNASTAKPLLHLWSLGIEEQFYIVWPLLLWLTWRSRFGFLPTMVALAVLSFAINIYLYRFDRSGDFYLPQARFWELSAGSILAYTTLNGEPVWDRDCVIREMQSLIGTLSLCGGAFIITQKSYFPGSRDSDDHQRRKKNFYKQKHSFKSPAYLVWLDQLSSVSVALAAPLVYPNTRKRFHRFLSPHWSGGRGDRFGMAHLYGR